MALIASDLEHFQETSSSFNQFVAPRSLAIPILWVWGEHFVSQDMFCVHAQPNPFVCAGVFPAAEVLSSCW